MDPFDYETHVYVKWIVYVDKWDSFNDDHAYVLSSNGTLNDYGYK